MCTLALARFLGVPVPPVLAEELELIAAERYYARQVLFVRMLGFVTRTAARRIDHADALRFEAFHEEAYLENGFELIDVPPASVDERADAVSVLLGSERRGAAPAQSTPGQAPADSPSVSGS